MQPNPQITPAPRHHKPRVPRAYTDQQLVFLRSHLPEFERRSQGAIRGDAKKYALERAQDFIDQFGLPEDFDGVEEPEPRFKEQIYNWFKNTIGRTRRKLEGRPRSGVKKVEKVTQAWSTELNSPNLIPYAAHPGPSSSSPSHSIAPVPYGGVQPSAALAAPAPTQQLPLPLAPPISPATLRDALLAPALDTPSLAGVLQALALAQPGPTPLAPAVLALFDAATAAAAHPHAPQDPHRVLLRRFLDACAYLPQRVHHAGVAGPPAGPRALQMALRRASVWVPPAPAGPTPAGGPAAPQPLLADEMERIAADRQRRKDHIQWARLHAAALELGALAPAPARAWAPAGGSFSELMARDAVWEADEVEWAAGVCVLRGIIRTGLGGDAGVRAEYAELLRAYEGRWKEIKDEARQALVTEVLLGAKDDLARLDNPMMG